MAEIGRDAIIHSMDKFLPSKKFLKWMGWAVGVVIVLFLIGNFIQGRREIFQSEFKKNNQDGRLDITLGEIVARDTDSDGLLDWEESLWKLDPKNPDSDGDGILDGKEAEILRQELNAGAEITGQEPTSNPTTTENFAKELLVTVVALQQSGNLTAENLQEITNSFEKEIKNSERPAMYDSSDLKIGEDNEGTVSGYVVGINKIMKKYPIKDEGVSAIIEKALAEDSAEDLNKIDPFIKKYQSMSKELLALVIPPAAITAHLQLTNSVYNLSDDFQSMKTVYDDPIRAFLAIIQHEKTLEELRLALASISSYFQLVKSTISP